VAATVGSCSSPPKQRSRPDHRALVPGVDRLHRCAPHGERANRDPHREPNLVPNTVIQAAADGAIFEAIFNQSDPEPVQRWPVDRNARELVIGDSRVTLRLEDEAWWINPNSASPALLEALLRVTSSDAESARRLASAVSEWVGSAPAPRAPNTCLADYRAAGLDHGPPSEPLETLAELGRVLSMTTATLAAVRPQLTLCGPPQPSAATADPLVVAALAAAAAPSAGSAAPGCGHDADHRDRAGSEQCNTDPLRDCPFWRRAAQRLPSGGLARGLIPTIQGIFLTSGRASASTYQGTREAGKVKAFPAGMNVVLIALPPLGVRDLDSSATSDKRCRVGVN
jgi:hypothetical protein